MNNNSDFTVNPANLLNGTHVLDAKGGKVFSAVPSDPVDTVAHVMDNGTDGSPPLPWTVGWRSTIRS